MTASTEPSTAAPPRAAGGCPTSSSSGTPRAAPPRCTRCCARHPQIFMPELKEPWFFAGDMRPRFQPRTPAPRPRRSRSTCALFAPPQPEQRVGRGLLLLPALARRGRARSRSCSPTRASSRSCASPRASCARCTCSCCGPRRDRARTSAGRSRSRPRAARAGRSRAARTGRSCCMYSDHVRYVEQLRRYHDGVPARAGAGADLRRLPRRQRGDGAPGAALPRRRRRRRRSRSPRPTRRVSMRSQQLDELLQRASPSGRGPVSRTRQGGRQDAHARAAAQARRSARRSAISSTGRPPPPDERADARAAPPLQGRGRGARASTWTATS